MYPACIQKVQNMLKYTNPFFDSLLRQYYAITLKFITLKFIFPDWYQYWDSIPRLVPTLGRYSQIGTNTGTGFPDWYRPPNIAKYCLISTLQLFKQLRYGHLKKNPRWPPCFLVSKWLPVIDMGVISLSSKFQPCSSSNG